jgi:hypothetical protein
MYTTHWAEVEKGNIASMKGMKEEKEKEKGIERTGRAVNSKR